MQKFSNKIIYFGFMCEILPSGLDSNTRVKIKLNHIEITAPEWAS